MDGHWNKAAAVGLKIVMRRSRSTQMMASSEALMMAASRFLLSCSSSLRSRSAAALSRSARRSVSKGPWSMMAQMKWASSSCAFSMRAMCRSPVKNPPEPQQNTTSLVSQVACSAAVTKASATRVAWPSLTNGSRKLSGGSYSSGRNRRKAMALLSSTRLFSSTTISASGTLENRVKKRSEAPSAAAWL